MIKYIVELEPGVWLAPWSGDPGRTLVKTSAKKYANKGVATRALNYARDIPARVFPKAEIYSIPIEDYRGRKV